jgi:hypothetical protein
MTDGAANEPAGSNPCLYAYNQAVAAKNAGIEVFTIGYGVASETCADENSGSPYRNKNVLKLLADMRYGHRLHKQRL